MLTPGLTLFLKVSLSLQVNPRGLCVLQAIQLWPQLHAHILEEDECLQWVHHSWMLREG